MSHEGELGCKMSPKTGMLFTTRETFDHNSPLSNALWPSLNSNGDISPLNLSYGVLGGMALPQ